MSVKMKIKKGDKVIVIAGSNKGKTGQVIRVLPQDRKVVVQGVNLAKVHQKPTRVSQGGIVPKELPLDVSNVALLDPSTNKPTRVGFKMTDSGKQRVAKGSGSLIEN